MGAWGCKPMDNDHALDWFADKVAAPLLAVIKSTIAAYLDQTEKDDLNAINAEAAAALLVDLIGEHTKMEYIDFSSVGSLFLVR